jgi:DNA-binding MarR family transcriptional regulator
LGRISKKLNRVTRDSISAYGLTTAQFFLLIALYEENGILISRLSEKVAVDKATLTGLLDRLERDKLVERKHDVEDRRAIKIYLADKAEGLREDLLEIYHQNNNMFLSVLSPQEKETFESVVDKLEHVTFTE